MGSLKRSIHFVRHAESLFNEVCSLQAKQTVRLGTMDFLVDAALSEKGKQQGKNAQSRIQNLNIQLAITSPYTRAISTCFLAHGHNNVLVTPLCGEKVEFICDVGTTKEQLVRRIPKLDFSNLHDNIWWFNPDRCLDPDAITCATNTFKLSQDRIEPEFLLKKRAQQFYQFLMTRPEKNIAVFSHLVFLRKFLNWQFGRGDFPIDNAEVISLEVVG